MDPLAKLRVRGLKKEGEDKLQRGEAKRGGKNTVKRKKISNRKKKVGKMWRERWGGSEGK